MWNYFRRFLMLECSHARNHFMTYISGEFVCWTLIWVSYSIILRVISCVTHCVVLIILNNSDIPITLWHANCIITIPTSAYKLTSNTDSLKHLVTILISNSILCSLKFLIFHKISMSSTYLDIRAIIPTVGLNLICILFPICLNNLFSFFFTFCTSNTGDEDNVTLVYTSIIRTAMWSLLIISSKISAISLTLSPNWITTSILWRLIKIEKTWSITFLLACSRSNISKLMLSSIISATRITIS